MLQNDYSVQDRTSNDSVGAQGISVCIGLFFDGTGNNAHNVQLPLNVCLHDPNFLNNANAKQKIHDYVSKMMGFTGFRATSYTNYFTNIHRLYSLYSSSDYKNRKVIQKAIYIEGPGTETGKPDSLTGQSLGILETGVMAKTDKAVTLIAREAEKIISLMPKNTYVKEVVFDLFGFSRGAAACRHFANRIFDSDPDITLALCKLTSGPEYSGKASGRTRFIGIFDTVASINTPTALLSNDSPATGELKLSLGPEIAENVFHITAKNEYRYNFPLISVKPVWPELALPGAHSDIGGGYFPFEVENYFMTRPATETVMSSVSNIDTQVYRTASRALHELEKITSITPFTQTHKFLAETWSDERLTPDRYGNFRKRCFAAVTLRHRLVRNDWSKVTLQVMVAAAKKAGVDFIPEDSEKNDFCLPSELLPLYEKALRQSESIHSFCLPEDFSAEEMFFLTKNFIHCSANWNAIELTPQGLIQGGAAPAAALGYINRPDEGWMRKTYTIQNS